MSDDSDDDEFDDHLPAPVSPLPDVPTNFDFPDPGHDSGFPDYDPDGFGCWWAVAKHLPHHLRTAPPLETASDSADSDSDYGFEDSKETEEEAMAREARAEAEKERKIAEEAAAVLKLKEEQEQREKKLQQERKFREREEERKRIEKEQCNLQLISLVSAIEEMSKNRSYPEMENCISNAIVKKGLVEHKHWVKKIIQLYETTLVRHGIM